MPKFAVIKNTEDDTNIEIFEANDWDDAVEYFKEEDGEEFTEMNTLVELDKHGEGTIYISYEVDGPGRTMGGHELEEENE